MAKITCRRHRRCLSKHWKQACLRPRHLWKGALKSVSTRRARSAWSTWVRLGSLLKEAVQIDTNRGAGQYKSIIEQAVCIAEQVDRGMMESIEAAAYTNCPRTGRWQSNSPSYHRKALKELMKVIDLKTASSSQAHDVECRGKTASSPKAHDVDCLAGSILRQADRVLSDADVLRVLEAFPFKKNKYRYNVMKRGGKWVYSSALGVVSMRNGRCGRSNLTHGCPNVVRLLSRWIRESCSEEYGKHFPFTTINVNKGFAAELHRDKNNKGPSLVRALGPVTRGGHLNYFIDDDDAKLPLSELSDENAVRLDPMRRWVLIDGHRAHSVEPFEGERYSLVFFTSSGFLKVNARDKEHLIRCGMEWPTKEAVSYFRGYETCQRSVLRRSKELIRLIGAVED